MYILDTDHLSLIQRNTVDTRLSMKPSRLKINNLRYSFALLGLLTIFQCEPINLSSQPPMRPISELISQDKSGWQLVSEWKNKAKNQVEVLPRNSAQAEQALYFTQVTTRSPMGAIIFETGGILIDGGWIRILGSGSSKLKRTLPEWNQGKSFNQFGEVPGFLLIADDAVGGFFALNGGGLDRSNPGKVFYFAPDSLTWENLDITYSQFIEFCFSGDLNEFYKGLRWRNWKEDLKGLSGDEAFIFYPYLFTKEGKDIEKVSRRTAPIQEVWQFSTDLKQQSL